MSCRNTKTTGGFDKIFIVKGIAVEKFLPTVIKSNQQFLKKNLPVCNNLRGGGRYARFCYGANVQNTWRKYLSVQIFGAHVSRTTRGKIQYQSVLRQPNRMLSSAQGDNVHDDDKNRNGFERAAVRPHGGDTLSKISAVLGRDRFNHKV